MSRTNFVLSKRHMKYSLLKTSELRSVNWNLLVMAGDENSNFVVKWNLAMLPILNTNVIRAALKRLYDLITCF